jgi:hypothetical protein
MAATLTRPYSRPPSPGANLRNVDYFNQVFLQTSPGYPHTYEAGFGYRF